MNEAINCLTSANTNQKQGQHNNVEALMFRLYPRYFHKQYHQIKNDFCYKLVFFYVAKTLHLWYYYSKIKCPFKTLIACKRKLTDDRSNIYEEHWHKINLVH